MDSERQSDVDKMISSAPPEVLARLRQQIEAQVRAELAGNGLLQVHAPHPTGPAHLDPVNNPKVVKVQVTVGARPIPGSANGESYPGVGCAYEFWPTGSTERMVTQRQYEALLKEPLLRVVNLTALEANARRQVEQELAAAAEVKAKTTDTEAAMAKAAAEAKAKAEAEEKAAAEAKAAAEKLAAEEKAAAEAAKKNQPDQRSRR